jgi:hypothetical protein
LGTDEGIPLKLAEAFIDGTIGGAYDTHWELVVGMSDGASWLWQRVTRAPPWGWMKEVSRLEAPYWVFPKGTYDDPYWGWWKGGKRGG